jgi:SanA protein
MVLVVIMTHWKRMKKRVFLWGTGLAFIAIAAVLACNIAVASSASGRVFDNAADVPAKGVGLVMGCSPTVYGRPNLYFKYRIEAAAELYRQGRVSHLLVTGDNHVSTYDEPSEMKKALVVAGVPEQRITCDYAGFRTLDSVVRAKEVFGLTSFTIISQPDHAARAVYLARCKDIDAVAFVARDPATSRMRLREYLARVNAVLDVYLLDRGPKFLGPRISLPVGQEPNEGGLRAGH